MSEKLPRHPGSNPHVRYERTDVSAWGVVGFGVALIVLAAIIHLVTWWMFRYFLLQHSQRQPFTAAYVPEDLPTEPRLEGLPRARPGLSEMAIPTPPNGYAWVDRKAGIVRIPVERAVDLLAGKLPAMDRPKPGAAGREERHLPDARSGRRDAEAKR